MAKINKINVNGTEYDIVSTSVYVTNTTPTTPTSYYPIYANGLNEELVTRANKRFYYYDTGTWASLNIGRENNMGILSIHYGKSGEDKYASFQPEKQFTANRTLYIPDTNGTISVNKQIVNITEPILQHQLNDGGYIGLNTNFPNIELNNKYIIWDLNVEKTSDSGFGRIVNYFQLDFTDKKPKNSTMLITFPPFQDFENDRLTWFAFYLNKGFVTIDNCRAVTNINYEGFRYADDSGSLFYFDFAGELRYSDVYIKIDFDEYGFATIYVYDQYEI